MAKKSNKSNNFLALANILYGEEDMKSNKLILGISLFVFFSILFLSQFAFAAPIVKDYSVSIPEFTVRDVGGKAYYEIKDFGLNVVLGLPLLPYKEYYFEIPFNAKDINVSLVSTNSRSLGQVLNLAVFQGMAPNAAKAAKPAAAATSAKVEYTLATFPEVIFQNLGESTLKGHRLICVGINPLIQNLNTKELTFNEVFNIRIQYTLDTAKAALDSQMKAKKSDTFEKLAQTIIYNYSENQVLKSPTQTQSVSLVPIDQVPIKYAIITLAANVNAVQPLADWKTKKGIPAKVYTVEDIEANYTGADLQEKIRKFLTEASPNPPNNPFYSPKFDWLLIAGEQGAGMPDMTPPEGIKLPSRYVGPVTWHADPVDTDKVPADYYFADCAGGSVADSFIYNWDTNNNGIYGELADDIRWIPDTYVGRIPVNTYSYISKVANKSINYEKTPPVGTWTKEALLCGAKLDGSTDAALLMQFVKNDFLDPAGLTSLRLNFLSTYPKDADLTEANFISYASAGRALIEWSAHGSYWTAMDQDGASGLRFVYFMNNIANGSKQSVVYSHSCDNGKFDYHSSTPGHIYCLGDSILRGEDTIPIHDWGAAFIGNARVDYYWIGWNSPSQGGGMGELYRFNEQLFSLGKHSVGQALYDMKLDMVNDFAGNGTFDPNTVAEFRKNLFTLNLLGDPEMPIWTDTPQTFNVQYVPSMTQYCGYIVTVKDSNNQPVSGARVTFLKSNDAYGTELTDVNGQVLVYVYVTTAGTMNLTVTKPNFIPFEALINVSLYSIPSHPSPWRTCPYVYLWNGSQFVMDNDILPAGNPMYYRDFYKLMKPLVAKNNKYLINILDYEDETSWIDMVKLIQVDHPKGTNIAPTPEGEILTYQNPLAPISAIDKNNNSQLAKVNKIENSEEHSYFGEKGDSLLMNFGQVKDKQNGARLIMRTDLKCPPPPTYHTSDSLHIYILMNEKNWQKISVVHPHQFWDEWAVNIPQKYLDKVKGDLKVRIEWTKPHRIDFVGLDTSKQVAVVKSELPLIKAVHSQGNNVLPTLEQADNKPAVTIKGQSINLEFANLSTPTQDRSFILLSAGQYKSNKK